MSFISTITDRDLSHYWGWLLLWGVALCLLGFVAVTAATATTILSVILLGTLILLSGVVLLVDTFKFWWRKWSGFFIHLLIALLYLYVGLMLICYPEEGSLSLTLLLGIFYIVVGALRMIFSLLGRIGRWQLSLFNGILSLVLGILITANLPYSGLFIIGLFIGIDLLFSGITYIMTALYVKRLSV